MTSRKLSAGGWLATEMSFKDVGIEIYAGANTRALASRGAGARFLHSVSGNDIEFDDFHTSEAQVILVTSRFSGDKPALVPGHIIPCQCKTWESTSAPEQILGCWSSAGSQPRSWWKVISSNVIQRN